MERTLPITLPADELAAFCQRNYIRWLALFGSALRSDLRPDSDLDVLVEFELDHAPSLFGLARIARELSQMAGRPVDLRTPEDLSRYVRAQVLEEAAVQHAQ